MKRPAMILVALTLVAALPAAANNVNKSIRVEAGESVDKDLSTVNGQIRIGDGATVRGEAETVNGGIDVGNDVQVDSVSTVNGGIDIGENTTVDGEVETVNGPISMDRGSSARKAATVNGPLTLRGVDIKADVSTYNGDITLSDGTSVGGSVRILEASHRSNNHRDRPLRITIEEGSVVHGDVIVEDDDLQVELYLRGGSVGGEVRGAKVIEK